MEDNTQFVEIAKQIVASAEEQGLTLRILGATAFRIHCPEYIAIHQAMARSMSDLDFVAYGKEDRKIEAFFSERGYMLVKAALTPELFASRRIFEQAQEHLHVDVFLDDLNMCHKIPFRNRLQTDSPTIPLAELVLEKTQIVRLNEKDIKDLLILLAAHPVGDRDIETINGAYIAELLSKDWGFYYTTVTNLDKVQAGLERYEQLFSAEDVSNIGKRISQLRNMIEQAPKGLKWKARAAIGTRVQWYNDVDEAERAEFLNDIG